MKESHRMVKLFAQNQNKLKVDKNIRSAGSLARAGSHRYQLTAWVPFPFTRGQLTMADSPHGGPGSPPRERPR